MRVRWIRHGLAELIGLFVDDGSFALAIVLWFVLVALTLDRLALQPGWYGALLFAGLSVILVAGTLRAARGR